MKDLTLTLTGEQAERLHCLLQEASGRLAELGSIFDPVLASRLSRAETALDRARRLIRSNGDVRCMREDDERRDDEFPKQRPSEDLLNAGAQAVAVHIRPRQQMH